MGDGITKTQIERLISGKAVQKKIEEQLTYDTMYDSVENMWSLLYTTGYLTQSETPAGNLVRLTIPNTEIRSIFRDSILKMFEKEIASDGAAVNAFCTALKTGNAAEVEKQFTAFMKNTISIRDTAVRKEFKESFDSACEEALQQVEDNDYTANLREDEMRTIWKYGIACYKKRCRVVAEKI